MVWVAIDPTNRQWVNERYVTVSYGRDFRDATPLRGTFKGSGGQAAPTDPPDPNPPRRRWL